MYADPAEILKETADSADLELEEQFSSLADEGLHEKLQEKALKWMLDIRRAMECRNPFSDQRYAYENSYADLLKKRTTRESLAEDVGLCQALGEAAKAKWISDIETADETILNSMHKKLISIWDEHLKKKQDEWTLRFIEKKREEYIDSMETWLKFIEAAKNAMDSMGIGNGRFWDLSTGDIQYKDNSDLLKWSKIFSSDVTLRKICESLGHEIIASRNSDTEMELSQTFNPLVKDRTIAEELSGIESGNRIEDLLPTELGLLGDTDLDLLFDMKFVENRLMCFSKQGYTFIDEEEPSPTPVSKDEDGFAGPVILCIDTSGSMAGTPEYIAKGVAFYIVMRARSENRHCYLINFSTRIETVSISPETGIDRILEFLSMSFNAGTDINPAINEAIRILDTEEYSKADVLTISDFVMPPDALDFLKKEIDEGRERRCRFHSLSIGHFAFAPRLSDAFDNNWSFDPVSQKISKMC